MSRFAWFVFFCLMSMSTGTLHTPLEIPMQEPSFVDRIKHIESRGRRFGNDGKILEGPMTRYGTAKGEMQVIDDTARDPGYGVAPAKDGSPDELARVGRDYAKALLAHYGGDEAKAGAAYNHGPGNVQKLLAKHGDRWMEFLPTETKNYVASLGSKAAPVVRTRAAPAVTPQGSAPAPAAVVAPPMEDLVMAAAPTSLPPEILASIQGQAPAAGRGVPGDAWGEFLKGMQGRATPKPLSVADIDFGSQKMNMALPNIPLAQVARVSARRPNFAAFSSWTGRAA